MSFRKKNKTINIIFLKLGITSLVGLFFLLSIFIFPTQAQTQTTNCTVNTAFLTQTASDQTLLNLINAHRQQNSLAPLSWSSSLKLAAAWMSNDMFTNNRFNHTDSLGREPGVRLTQCGYIWTNFGENIFPNSSDPQAAFDAWKNSAPHNANMLNPSYKEAGIALKGNYWTLDLGSSSSIPVSPTNGVVPTAGLTPLIPTLSPTISVTPTISSSPSIILNPTNTQIKIVVKLPGIGISGNKLPKHLTRQSNVGIFDLDNKKILSGSGFLKYNGKDGFEGVINLGQLANGVYYVKVSILGTLISLIVPEFQTINHQSINNLPAVTLIQGDLNNDNIINIKDFNIALPCFQDKKCETADLIDFNDDSAANVIDYNIFLASFKRLEGD
ncbi:MAG TPA: CAP domain-containing protein [Candidatus Limnocylindrales bacterium]|nr:CAP domain-containing protein [Candidatus Limnocylindrales bacterium]